MATLKPQNGMTKIQKVVTAAEMLATENQWFASGEMTLEQLMDRVGRRIADWVIDDLAAQGGDPNVLALVGKGNNGGDAIVAAKMLRNAGFPIKLAIILPRERQDPLLAELIAAGGEAIPIEGPDAERTLANLCNKSNLILDGVFGFSISRPIDKPISTYFQIVKNSGKRIAAIDMPSGANPDTGEFDPNGLPADVCLPVGLLKIGPAVRFGAPEYGTETALLDVDIPDELTRTIKREVNSPDLAKSLLPDRDATSHKGDFGRTLLICGSNTYVGAASLATRSCLRSGVGLVTLATPISAYRNIAGNIPEATYIPLKEDENGVIPDSAFRQITERNFDADSVVFGVGASLSSGARELIARLISDDQFWAGRTGVIDADGLTIVSNINEWWKVFEGNLVITPHPGEMSRLLGVPIAQVEADRRSAAETASDQFNCVTVLKGATTLIAAPGGRLRVNTMPNHGLARGGSGDVLAGLIGGLCAKSDPFDAASLGVYLHSLAAKSAREELTAYAMTAGDLITHLPDAFRALAS